MMSRVLQIVRMMPEAGPLGWATQIAVWGGRRILVISDTYSSRNKNNSINNSYIKNNIVNIKNNNNMISSMKIGSRVISIMIIRTNMGSLPLPAA